MKKFFQILIWTVLLLAVVAALAFVEINHRETVCHGFDLVIMDQQDDPLISAEDVKTMVLAATDSLIGKKISDIDHLQIHAILNEIPYVSETDIQTDLRGNITIELSLRKAIIRVINNAGFTYYLDTEGMLMPVNPGHPSRVIIFNGAIKDGLSELKGKAIHIEELDDNVILNNIYIVSTLIEQSPFLKRLIAQLWLGKNGEIEITPILGNYIIKLGGFEDIETKLAKLETFYREGAGKAGWQEYRSIDLRYNNQIICSKK